jgi:hypothetical protein
MNGGSDLCVFSRRSRLADARQRITGTCRELSKNLNPVFSRESRSWTSGCVFGQLSRVLPSCSSADRAAVEELARRLAKEGVQAWLDKWNLIPGDPWQPAIEKALVESETCAVFVGPSGLSPWQNEDMRAAIDQRVREGARCFRVIPVLLPGAERAELSSLPTFLVANGF